MKLNVKILLFFWALLMGLGYSQITWQFNYTDAAGTGFNDATWGASRRGALESASATLGSWLGHSAIVQLDVTSEYNSSEEYLAYAGSSASSSKGFNKTVLQKKIQSNGSVDLNGTDRDGYINFNFFYSWNYGDTVSSSQFDFKGVALHELTHTLGFGSFIKGAGENTSDSYSDFDRFLVDSVGNPLINPTTFRFDTAQNSDLTSGVYFNGESAVAAYGGLVPLFTPRTFMEGSSLSHLDENSFTRDIMMSAYVNPGLAIRQWNNVETEMMRDLGYSIMIPEPSTYFVFLLLGFCFVVVKRLKKSNV